jgi:hypothetical protein
MPGKQWSYSGVTLVLYCCYTVVTLVTVLLHCCHTTILYSLVSIPEFMPGKKYDYDKLCVFISRGEYSTSFHDW